MTRPGSKLTVVAIADTHGYHAKLKLPAGDVLIHAGDLTQRGTLEQIEEAHAFLAAQPHRHKIVIAGNHDFAFQDRPSEARALMTRVAYLQDEALSIEGLKFYGSPWQPWFYDWAFNLPRGPRLAQKWALIPADTRVLITHGPPRGFGDLCFDGERVGCEDLLARVMKVRPAVHLFGHIHEGRGNWLAGGTRIVNVTTAECQLPATVIRLEACPEPVEGAGGVEILDG